MPCCVTYYIILYFACNIFQYEFALHYTFFHSKHLFGWFLVFSFWKNSYNNNSILSVEYTISKSLVQINHCSRCKYRIVKIKKADIQFHSGKFNEPLIFAVSCFLFSFIYIKKNIYQHRSQFRTFCYLAGCKIAFWNQLRGTRFPNFQKIISTECIHYSGRGTDIKFLARV